MKKSNARIGNQNFLITVRSQENHTWQGTISWIEGKKEQNFRSVLELLKLMDSVIDEEGASPGISFDAGTPADEEQVS